MLDRGLDVLHHAGRGQRLDRRLQREAGRHVVLAVAQFDARLDAVEGRRRHRQVALRCIAVGDRADVRVDAEDLLQHDDRALGGAGRLGDVGGEGEAVGGLQVDECTHGGLLCQWSVESLRCTKSSRSWPQNSSPSMQVGRGAEDVGLDRGLRVQVVVLPDRGLAGLRDARGRQPAFAQQFGQDSLARDVALLHPHGGEHRAGNPQARRPGRRAARPR